MLIYPLFKQNKNLDRTEWKSNVTDLQINYYISLPQVYIYLVCYHSSKEYCVT